MCGIFGFVSQEKKPADLVLAGLKRLEYRGYDSWGIVVGQTKKLLCEKHTGKIGQATTVLPASIVGLGHTRWATHGNVTVANAHPQFDCHKKLAFVHNGIIENYEELKQALKSHHFLSQTDTEIFAHLVESYSELTFLQAVRKAFNKLEGLNAIVAVDSSQKEIIAVKTGSPLILGFGKNINFVSSDPAALIAHTRKVFFLEDNQIVRITPEKVEIFDLPTGKKINFRVDKITWSFEETQKGKFDHFMLKEIYEQPKVINNIANLNFDSINQLAGIITKSWGTTMVACGSAAYAAIVGSYLFSKIAKRHVNYVYGSEFGYNLDFINKKSLVIALSQSGETIDIIDSVKKAKTKGASIVALVNVLGSTLYRLADFKILLNAGPEKAVASTKAFIAKLANLILLAYAFTNKKELGREILLQASIETKRILQEDYIVNIQKLAKKIIKKSDIYAIGRGLSYPIALEATLKIKEISYIHAEGFAAGELKHGFIALVEKDTPCLVFLPDDETKNSTLAGAMEVKARGGYIIGIASKNHEVFDYYLPVANCQEATIIPNTVVAQLLAYYLSVYKGIDPDKPRNLAKSVTVK